MKQLTDKEKARLFTGKDHWHTYPLADHDIPSIMMSDGPSGLRIEKEFHFGFNPSKEATAYPTASITACSFDPDLLYEMGSALASECAEEGVDVLLGPGVNHKRSPLCGRNFEYFSEDPLLSGELAAGYIRGLQEHGTGASLKHFAANSREKNRLISNSIIDERTLQEIYLRQFRTAVRKSHPWTLMTAYNKLDGIHCAENKALMEQADEWGFDGAFISDWGGVYDVAASMHNGLNLEMPGGDIGSDRRILAALKEGRITQEELDRSTGRILHLIERCGHYERKAYDRNQNLKISARILEESSVLMKNDNILPLRKNDTICLISPYAKKPKFKGSGSSQVEPHTLDSLYEQLERRNIHFAYEEGFDLHDSSSIDEEKIRRAKAVAAYRDKVIIVCAFDEEQEAEGLDRKDMKLPAAQIRLIKEVCSVNSNVIVILQTGSPAELPFEKDVKGILYMGLGGSCSGEACASLLYGETNPCGRLAETWPYHAEDAPCASWYESERQIQYRETIFTGYRYYDTFHVPVQYPFGYGLSYTDFRYRNLSVEIKKGILAAAADIENTGDLDGREVLQIYSHYTGSAIARAEHELIGFVKVFVPAHETVRAEVKIPLENLAYFDTGVHAYCIENGDVEISVRKNVNEEICRTVIHVDGENRPYTSIDKNMYTADESGFHISDEAFRKILGYDIPEDIPSREFTADTTIAELRSSRLGKLLYFAAERYMSHENGNGIFKEYLDNIIIRQLLWLDQANWDTVELGVDYLNRHGFKTLKKLIKSFGSMSVER